VKQIVYWVLRFTVPRVTQQHTFTNQRNVAQHKINTKKLKPHLVASYNRNREGLFWFRCFINLKLTYLLRHLLTYLKPRTHSGISRGIESCYVSWDAKHGPVTVTPAGSTESTLPLTTSSPLWDWESLKGFTKHRKEPPIINIGNKASWKDNKHNQWSPLDNNYSILLKELKTTFHLRCLLNITALFAVNSATYERCAQLHCQYASKPRQNCQK